jgi:protein O-GlcNAc transferase
VQEAYTAALAAQQQGDSVTAHRLMQAASLKAQQWAEHSQSVEAMDRAARWFSHQMLLQWSFGDHNTLGQQLDAYYHLHVKNTPRYYAQQGLFLQGRDLKKEPLRVGFLSPDLRNCSAARLIADLFAYAPENIERFVYATYPHDLSHDEVFLTLYHYMIHERQDRWYDASKDTQPGLAERIYHDGIDILIDLAGHTSLSNLRVMAHQPAPLQLSGLTFNGGIGLGDRCLRATDEICTPTPDYYPHDLPLMLPVWISHGEALSYPLPAPLNKSLNRSLKTSSAFRLGCAHHPGRLSESCLHTWGKIFAALPKNSQLHLKHPCYARPETRSLIQRQFVNTGFHPEQLLFSEGSDYADYLSFYDDLDLALDPFPYHGGLVSCDALARGVPLVTLSQAMHGGSSLLQQIGLLQGIAHSPEVYVEKALELLHDPALRHSLRHELPQRFAQSMAGQPQRWVQDIFNALERWVIA